MRKRNYRLTETSIPEGYRVYHERLPIRGVNFRKTVVRKFIKSGSLQLELALDPSNEHDPNAIKIYGITKGLLNTRHLDIGFVPKEIAEQLVRTGFSKIVIPRLYMTYLGDEDYFEIDFQILGPAERFLEYDPPITEGAETPSAYIPRIKQLKSLGELDEAITLLVTCVGWTETLAKSEGGGVAPWFYQQLAMIYRKKKLPQEEIAILERFEGQPKSPGITPKKLADRLSKLR